MLILTATKRAMIVALHTFLLCNYIIILIYCVSSSRGFHLCHFNSICCNFLWIFTFFCSLKWVSLPQMVYSYGMNGIQCLFRNQIDYLPLNWIHTIFVWLSTSTVCWLTWRQLLPHTTFDYYFISTFFLQMLLIFV